jgi:hypothetical protein
MPKKTPDPDQETRNDDPLVQDQQEQKARGEKDQAEGDRSAIGDERIPGADEPRGDRVHGAREERRPGGGRKGQPN